MDEVVEVRLGTQGRIVLPRELREQLAAEEGTVYRARVVDGALVLEPRDVVLKRMRQRVADAVDRDRSVVDELLTERRAEAGG